MMTLRKIMAVMLMAVGIAIFVRGLIHCLSQGLLWHGIIVSAIVGGLVFSLGLSKWRYITGR
ncbi:MAG: hypothetical protein RMK18_08440 [Armatimonadota bacterium]|nr:hypothetical protein [Armatimonadota bacterium]MCX7777715.1 hypothetical protein [Armatimonadota bacterium]MDW8025870.1 hypothetical protein [Armatimonadota bacterium]